MLTHFLMTFVWGVAYWMPFEKEAEENAEEKKKN